MSTLKFTKKPNPMLKEAREWAAKFTRSKWSGFPKNTRIDEASKLIDRAVVVFEEKRNFLSALLQLDGKYTAEDGDKIVDDLIGQLKFYSEYRHPVVSLDKYTSGNACRVVIQNLEHLSFLGPVIGPLLVADHEIRIVIEECSILGSPEYFLAGIVEILNSIGTTVTTVHRPRTETQKWNNAMIILDSADLSAAVRGAVENVWSCRGRTFWTPNYIYIEESVFDLFVRLLEVDAVNYVNAMGIAIVNPAEREAGSVDNKVIQPTDRQHFRFFVGCHPCRTEPEVGEGAILLPFRTTEEIVGSLADCLSVSVWTEKMCRHITSRLKVKTIWVNCHGITEPGTPPSDGFLPHWGLRCLEEMIMNVSSFHCLQPGRNEKRSNLLSTELKSPSHLTLNERISLLEPLRRDMSTENVHPLVAFAGSTLRTTESGLEVKTYQHNRGPLVLNLGSSSSFNYGGLLAIVHYAILNGSGVVLNSRSLEKCPESLITLESKGYLIKMSDSMPVVVNFSASYLLCYSEDEFQKFPIVYKDYSTYDRKVIMTEGLDREFLNKLQYCHHFLRDTTTVISR